MNAVLQPVAVLAIACHKQGWFKDGFPDWARPSAFPGGPGNNDETQIPAMHKWLEAHKIRVFLCLDEFELYKERIDNKEFNKKETACFTDGLKYFLRSFDHKRASAIWVSGSKSNLGSFIEELGDQGDKFYSNDLSNMVSEIEMLLILQAELSNNRNRRRWLKMVEQALR